MDPVVTIMTDSSIRWQASSLEDLGVNSLYQVLKLRQDIFIVEQNCIYSDLDGRDQDSIHLCGWHGSELFAYLRALPPGLDYAESSLGRIVVSPQARGMSLGRELVQRGVELNRERWPDHDLKIGAQAHLQKFYHEFGFETDSDVYDEDGIAHVKMLLRFTS